MPLSSRCSLSKASPTYRIAFARCSILHLQEFVCLRLLRKFDGDVKQVAARITEKRSARQLRDQAVQAVLSKPEFQRAMSELRAQGFTDERRNVRLLLRFDCNMSQVRFVLVPASACVRRSSPSFRSTLLVARRLLLPSLSGRRCWSSWTRWASTSRARTCVCSIASTPTSTRCEHYSNVHC